MVAALAIMVLQGRGSTGVTTRSPPGLGVTPLPTLTRGAPVWAGLSPAAVHPPRAMSMDYPGKSAERRGPGT